jgi:adenylate cyclase
MNFKDVILVSFISIILVSLFLVFGIFSNINIKLSDGLYGGKFPLDNIVILAIDDQSIQEIGRWPWNRTVIAKSIDKLQQARIVGVDIGFFERSDREDDKILRESLEKVNSVIAMEYISFLEQDGKIKGERMLIPIEELKGINLGYINVLTDGDGITRAINNKLSEDYTSFVGAIYQEYKGKKPRKENRLLINYVGSPETFKTYPILEVINGNITEEEFKNKIVLIGATASNLHDTVFVPTSKGKAMAGVEVHANILQMMINESYLENQSKTSIFLSILIGSLLISLIFYKYNLKFVVISMIILILGYIFFSIKIFEKGVLMNLVYFPMSILVTFTLQSAYFYTLEKKSKAQLKEAFSKYVSEEVIGQILKNPSKLKLGGEKEEITVLFSDIRGFTTISENMKPERLVHFMNEYLSEMTRIILKHRGVVDKYIGDAIMAFWGAPIKTKNHAEIACEASLDMLVELRKLNEKLQKEGYPQIKIGIGINSGDAIIGNMGSYERFDYTAMGDTINLGSRLEGQTKNFGVSIIIGEKTKKSIGNKFVTKRLGKVKVKGKNKEVIIYELIGKK